MTTQGTPEQKFPQLVAPNKHDYYTTHHQTAKFDGHDVHYDFFEPDVATEVTPILINNGYCAPAIVYDALAIGLAQNGRRVIRIHPPRSVSLGRRVLGGHIANPLKKHAQAAYVITKHASTEFGFEQVDELGHSMGTPISLMFAAEKPEWIRSVMCTGGAGIDGAGGLFVMGAKGVGLLKKEVYDERKHLSEMGNRNHVAREVGRHILGHPLDTLAEGYYVSRANAVPALKKARANGVKIGAILFGNDSFFDPQRVLNHVGENLDYVEVIEGAKHIHPQIYPIQHAKEQVQAFSVLNSTSPTAVVA